MTDMELAEEIRWRAQKLRDCAASTEYPSGPFCIDTAHYMDQIIAALRRGPVCERCQGKGGLADWQGNWRPCPVCQDKRPPSGEMAFVLKAARELSAFIKSHSYPEIGSADFVELTRLADVQDTELRALSAAEAEGRKS